MARGASDEPRGMRDFRHPRADCRKEPSPERAPGDMETWPHDYNDVAATQAGGARDQTAQAAVTYTAAWG